MISIGTLSGLQQGIPPLGSPFGWHAKYPLSIIQEVVGAELQPHFDDEVVVLEHGLQRVVLVNHKVLYLQMVSYALIKTLGSTSERPFWPMWRRECASLRSCDC